VHRSWCAENPGWRSNERLEFLGDSVLGIVITDHLFTTYPELAEGDLAKVRASVVSAAALSEVADELLLGDAMLLGKGEDGSGGREKPSILADALEAVLGVVYVEVGMDAARDLVLRLLLARTTEAATGPGGQDYKTRLQEIAARQFADQPAYEVTDQGPDHAKHFFAEVRVDGAVRGRGQGRSKKQAEQAAARDAWQRLRDGGDPLPAAAVPADPTMEAAAGA
jgi:ribonuclease-3